DADPLQGPSLSRRDKDRPFVGQDASVAAGGGARAGLPGDGPAGLEQVVGRWRDAKFDRATAADVALRGKQPFVFEAANKEDAATGRQDFRGYGVRPRRREVGGADFTG